MRHMVGNHLQPDKPSSLPKSFGGDKYGRVVPAPFFSNGSGVDDKSAQGDCKQTPTNPHGRQHVNPKWTSVNIPNDDATDPMPANPLHPSGTDKYGVSAPAPSFRYGSGVDKSVPHGSALIRNKFNDLSTPSNNHNSSKPVLCIRGVNITKTSKIIYLMCALVTRIFSNMIKASFAESHRLNKGFIQFIDCYLPDETKLSANIGILETYVNCIYPVMYTIIKNNVYMDLAEVENDLGLVVIKSGRDYLVAMYIYLRELCKMHAGIERFVNHKIILDISMFIKTHDDVFEHTTYDSIKNKNIVCDIKWFDAIYTQFSMD